MKKISIIIMMLGIFNYGYALEIDKNIFLLSLAQPLTGKINNDNKMLVGKNEAIEVLHYKLFGTKHKINSNSYMLRVTPTAFNDKMGLKASYGNVLLSNGCEYTYGVNLQLVEEKTIKKADLFIDKKCGEHKPEKLYAEPLCDGKTCELYMDLIKW